MIPKYHFNFKRMWNYELVKKDIVASMDDKDYDDGSYGPVLVRLAWVLPDLIEAL